MVRSTTNQYYLFRTGYLRKVLKLPILLGEGVYFNGLFEVGKVFAPPFKSQVPGDVSEAGRASVQYPVILTLIRLRFLLTLGILYLMITKPDLATSLFILLGAIVVGLVSAATAWTARPRPLS